MSNLMSGDALPAHSFTIEIDGAQIPFCKSISGLGLEVEVLSTMQNNPQGMPTVSKTPGTTKGGSCTVVRGSSDDDTFNTWVQQGVHGQLSTMRRNISVIYMDYERSPVKRWNLTRAWCSKYDIAQVEAGSSGNLEETITINYEDLVEVPS